MNFNSMFTTLPVSTIGNVIDQLGQSVDDLLGPSNLATGRSNLGLARARFDLLHPLRGLSPEDMAKESADPPAKQHDFVDALIENNKDLWTKLLNHPFCQKMGNGSARLDGFKDYMVQDFLYLRSYVRFKLGFYYKTDDWAVLSTEAPKSIQNDVDYANYQLKTCTQDLNIPDTTVLAATPRPKVKEYIEYENNAIVTESWFSLHVLMLPCIIGYHDIASKLKDDPSTKKDTIYYKLWIDPNSQGSSPQKYRGKPVSHKWSQILNRANRSSDHRLLQQEYGPDGSTSIRAWALERAIQKSVRDGSSLF
ncbi:hypothetical protein FRC07_003888 [Ceratobasidium sp. 392]|nr:hypothetical protein FRC07_003888 [Ceratobasidium sp. 392]